VAISKEVMQEPLKDYEKPEDLRGEKGIVEELTMRWWRARRAPRLDVEYDIPQLVTTVTDAVIELLEAWDNRQLEAMSRIVFFDAMVLKIREYGHVATDRFIWPWRA